MELKSIKKLILESCQNLDLAVIEEEIKLEHPVDSKFGDLSTNVAMAIANQAKTNPLELAKKIKEDLEKNIEPIDFIEKIEVAGAGFINFYFGKNFLIEEAEKINYEIEFKNNLSEAEKNKTMIIDYSAPNIAKPFGIGHLRSTNIGQAIYNIYKILGWNCIGDNHIGDWGTQFGKLIFAIKEWGSEQKIENMTIEDLEKLYVKFHKEAENNENLTEKGREWFSKLENGDKEARDIWQKCIEISTREFNRVYKMLDVKIDFTHGESFYENMLKDVIGEIEKKGIIKKSEGAKIVEFKNMPPAMIEKSNGTTTYFTRDMATIKYRLNKWNPDLIIYEVGVDQELHFKQLFETAKMMGWKTEMVHVAHGLIRWSTGKFSTRKGDTIHLSDVIEKAMEKAKEIAPKNDEETVKAVAIGAIKFNDLSQDPKRDIIFDWEKVMSLNGDSGPYLQYTYARCLSVLKKTEIKEQKDIENIPEEINDEEMALIKEFYKFEEKIVEAAQRYSPAVIAEYLLGIARKYNEFYAKNRILEQKEETFRIFLTKTTSNVLKIGLNLLGIKTVERM